MSIAVDTSIAPVAPDIRRWLVGLTREEIGHELAEVGVPARSVRMRANQLWHWIYYRGARSFEDMTNISKGLRTELDTHFHLARGTVTEHSVSDDRTRKWVLSFGPDQEIETVFIPEEDRGALCVSSQVGCTLNCRFCHTGTQPWVKNLTAGEIVAQILHARDSIGEWPSPKEGRMISNIVLMGMGEPLYNYDNVAKALRIVMDQEGIAISKRRITLSTSGVVPEIERVGDDLGVGLAISLHAVRDELRDELVPLNRKYPIKDLLNACRRFPSSSNARRITFEYVMLKDVNDSPADARELVRLLQGIPAKVNLIPFNAWPGAPYECSEGTAITIFAEIVNNAGYSSPVRTPRGRDIMAACGQLKSASVKKRASKLP